MHNRTLPKTDTELAMWSIAFVALVATDYATFGVSEAMRDEAVTAYATFASALATAKDPAKRTSTAIIKKDEAAATWRRIAARIIALARAQPTVSDGQLVALGLPLRAPNVAVAAPDRAPSLQILGVSGRTVSLRANDFGTQRRGRPATAAGLVLFSHVGNDAPNDIRDWRYEGTSSSVTLSVTFDAALPIGQQVWFSAQWLSPRLEAGPPAKPVYAHLTYGMQTSTRGLRRAA